MRRIVSVWLPDWPITVRSRAAGSKPPPEGPFALVERTPRGLLLAALNPSARALGLRRGQPHADARAAIPALESEPADPERDAAALQHLALWAERYSPCVALDRMRAGSEGLFLDMTGGAHLFGGEEALLAELEQRLAAAGMAARAAMADTPGAAWALARFGVRRIAPPSRTREALAELPVEALRLADKTLVLLRRFGLKHIGDLYGLPRGSLARRFRGEEGMELVRRLDQALGVEGEPLLPVRPAPLYRAWRVFPEPMIDVEGVAWALPPLVEALSVQLERDGKGARRLRLTAFRVDGRATAIEAGLSAPAASAAHLLRLLKERGLERLDLGFGADALMVEACRAEAARSRQGDLTQEDPRAGETAVAALVDRVEARLGEGTVLRPVLRQSHVPERSETWARPGQGAKAVPPPPPPGEEERPLLLFDPPEAIEALAELPDSAPARFLWRRVMRKVARAEGPERLAPEWWAAPAGPRPERTRDYYRVEDDQGRRYWLYREGLYGREGDTPPSWWLHGVFA